MNREDAIVANLVSHDGNGVSYIYTDTDPSWLSGLPPNAIRITSKAELTHGLFVAVVNNMPGGYCGITSTCECPEILYGDI